jgi:beta-glucosidase
VGLEAPDTVRDVERPIEVAVELQNAGSRAGAEVVQVYLRHLAPSLPRPDRELVGFARAELEPGETRRVTIAVVPERLAYYHDGFDQWVIEPGEYELLVGASAADIEHAARFTLTVGTMPPTVYTLHHTLGDLYGDPQGRVVVDFLASRMGFGSLAEAGPEDFLAAAMRQMTFRQVSNFSGGQVTVEALNGLLNLINGDMAPAQVRALLERAAGGAN